MDSLKKVYLLVGTTLSKWVSRHYKILVLTPDAETVFRWRRANPGAEEDQMAYAEELEDGYCGPSFDEDYRAWKDRNTTRQDLKKVREKT